MRMPSNCTHFPRFLMLSNKLAISAREKSWLSEVRQPQYIHVCKMEIPACVALARPPNQRLDFVKTKETGFVLTKSINEMVYVTSMVGLPLEKGHTQDCGPTIYPYFGFDETFFFRYNFHVNTRRCHIFSSASL